MAGGSRRQFLVFFAALAIGGVPALARDTLLLGPRLGTLGTKTPAGKITPPRFSAASAGAAINAVRTARGRNALRHNGTLQSLAMQQARRLASLELLSHTPGPGLSLKERARRAGYRGQVAENLAGGYETFEEAIKAWLHSSYHRTTLISDRYTRFGAGVAISSKGEDDRYGTYWAIILGN
ncbi:MAG: CAP domain-containing protein [Devosia sp.]